MKLKKSKELRERVGVRGGHTTEVGDILPLLPKESCFFDCRHFVYDLTSGVLPFALSTRTCVNNQQYLMLWYEEKTEDNSG